jgi:hypothetical protein
MGCFKHLMTFIVHTEACMPLVFTLMESLLGLKWHYVKMKDLIAGYMVPMYYGSSCKFFGTLYYFLTVLSETV